jgi:hypothetical protein
MSDLVLIRCRRVGRKTWGYLADYGAVPDRKRAGRYCARLVGPYLDAVRANSPGWEFRVVPHRLRPGHLGYHDVHGNPWCLDCGPLDRKYLRPITPTTEICTSCRRGLMVAAKMRLG